MTKALCSIFMSFLLFPGALPPAAAQVDPWQRVQLVEQGKPVNIRLLSGKSVKGKMQSWSADGITITQGRNRTVQVPKADVDVVRMPAGLSRAKRAGYAALIGGGGGAALFASLCAADNDCDIAPSAMAAGAALFIGGISAGVAALIPQHKEVIYRASPKQ